MYLSVCKKEFNGIKAGELFDTYQRINYVFIREKGSNQEFQSLSFQEYSSYFIEFKDYVFLPIIQKEIKLVGLFKKREEIVYKRVDDNQSIILYKHNDKFNLVVSENNGEISQVKLTNKQVEAMKSVIA